ncbi:MAG TPA: hypothetical protein VKB51_07255 [bacterium]|nr:hypothetical protein [bacterium]
MIRRVPLLGAALLVALLLTASPALACKEDVQHAKARLADLKRHAYQAKPKERAHVAAMLAAAAKELANADKDCKAATNLFEKGVAVAEVASANASMTSAAIDIPDK